MPNNPFNPIAAQTRLRVNGTLAIMETHNATLQFNASLLREAVWFFWRRTVGVGILIALFICIALLICLLGQGDRSWLVGFVAAVLCFGTAMVVAVYFVHYKNTFQKFRNMGSSATVVFSASNDSFTVSSGAATSTLPWSSVKQVWKLKNCWLLLFSKAQFMTLPLAGLSDATQTFVLSRIADAGGKTDG